MIFANDRDLYREMFIENEDREKRGVEEEVEWKIPESPEEIEQLLRDIP